jgi:hypothetical protein
MPSATIIRATESFTFRGPNGPVSIKRGSTFHKESPRLQGLSDEALEKNFVPFEPDHGIERATAAPGERRKGGPRRATAEEKTEAEGANDKPAKQPSDK